jgi:hypothetical protein
VTLKNGNIREKVRPVVRAILKMRGGVLIKRVSGVEGLVLDTGPNTVAG